MGPTNLQHPEVREADYLGADLGPPEDTDVFHRATPAPGQRVEVAPAGTSRSDDALVDRIARPAPIARPLGRAPRLQLPEIPVWSVFAGVGVLTSIALLCVLAIAVLGSEQPEPPPPADTTTAAEEGTFEGLPVKKGLR